MSNFSLALVATVMLSVLAVVGDYFLKLAGTERSPYTGWHFLLGLLLYSVSAFCAVFALRHLKMATVGAVYCVSIVILLTLMGLFVFKETLHPHEIIGLCLAVTSLVMLSRFA